LEKYISWNKERVSFFWKRFHVRNREAAEKRKKGKEPKSTVEERRS
jgi:hypothetical protein